MAINQEKNFSSIPNQILDATPFLNLKNLESRIFFLILRETYGFHKRTALISASWFMRCTGTADRGNISRAVRGLVKKEIIKRHSSTDFETASAYQINEEHFKKVIHRVFPNYPKRQDGVPSNRQDGVPSNRQEGVPSNRQEGVPSNRQDIKESIKETNKETFKEIIPDLLQKFALKNYTQEQIESLKKEIAKQTGTDKDSEFVTVTLKAIIHKTSQKREIKDKYAYTFQSCRNLGRDIQREARRA